MHVNTTKPPWDVSGYGIKIISTNGKLMVWIGGLGFESGYHLVTIPFIFEDPKYPKHRATNPQFTIS